MLLNERAAWVKLSPGPLWALMRVPPKCCSHLALRWRRHDNNKIMNCRLIRLGQGGATPRWHPHSWTHFPDVGPPQTDNGNVSGLRSEPMRDMVPLQQYVKVWDYIVHNDEQSFGGCCRAEDVKVLYSCCQGFNGIELKSPLGRNLASLVLLPISIGFMWAQMRRKNTSGRSICESTPR